MKRINLLISAILLTAVAFAQSKNPTNKKEIDDKVKQAQQQLDKLTPEQRKMLEQMGMSTKMPTIPGGATDADVKTAVSGGSAFGVPSKNAVLIGAISEITLTEAMIPAYIKTLNEYVEKGIANDAKLFAQQVYSSFKTNKYDAVAIGNSAVGYWISGQPEIAVYMMGRACADNATDADMLNNFSAMISMGGAPHRAIPLLDYLNKQYPDNSNVLNNLGQAWFYLGDLDKANVQLEKAVKAFAYNPQANYTQCLIAQSKGDTPKAIEKMKNSLQYSYSMDKVNMLAKMGYKVKGSDMRKPFKPETNPLGLRNFVRPNAPTTYAEELKLSADWDAFEKQANEKSMQLARELLPYQQLAIQKAEQAYAKYEKDKVKLSGLKTGSATATNIYRGVAEKNLDEMNKPGGTGYRLEKVKADVDAIVKDFQTNADAKRKALEKQYAIIADKETELAKKGENIGSDGCKVQEKYSEWVYSTYNIPLENAYQNYLHQLYVKITEELYWEQFTQDDAEFGASKITAKKTWLGAVSGGRYFSTNLKYCPQKEDKAPSSYKLAEFDDTHCAFISELDFIVSKYVSECGKTRIEFDAGRLSGKANFKFDDKGQSRFEKMTVEATVIDKTIRAGSGPAQIGANVKAGVGMEISSSGIEDVYVAGEAKVTAGAGPTEINIASASGRLSLMSGSTSGAISGFGK